MVKAENIEPLIQRFRYFESYGFSFNDAMESLGLTDLDGTYHNAWVAAVILNKDAK